MFVVGAARPLDFNWRLEFECLVVCWDMRSFQIGGLGKLHLRGPGGRASPKHKFEAFIRIVKADLCYVEMFWIEVFTDPAQQFFMLLIVRVFQCC